MTIRVRNLFPRSRRTPCAARPSAALKGVAGPTFLAHELPNRKLEGTVERGMSIYLLVGRRRFAPARWSWRNAVGVTRAK